MPDGYSRAVPPLPIPNRTVKRFCADDSADTGVKVGYCQAIPLTKSPPYNKAGIFLCARHERVLMGVSPECRR